MRTNTESSGPVLRIAIYAPTDYGYTRKIIQGAAAACIECDLSSVLIDPKYLPLPDPKKWNAHGAIVAINDQQSMHAARSWGIPVINISARLKQSEFPSVYPDNHRIGQIAAEHFLYQKARTFATNCMPAARFSDERTRGYCETVEGAGHSVRVFPDTNSASSELLAFLRQARKPIGFFVITDTHATVLLRSLTDAGIAIPRDVQIVGVDNDELLCLMSNPRLSSVDGHFELVGQTAVKLLHRWLLTGRRPPDETLVRPAGLVMRQSSNLSITDDELVNQALQLIRTKAQTRLTVKQLTNRLATSRRNLELRFRQVLGSTPAKEIIRVQVERACQLLIDTDLPLLRVAESSGLGYERQMRMVFRRALGVTPSGYREQFRQRTGG